VDTIAIPDTDLVLNQVVRRPAPPQLKAIIRRVAATLATAVVAPAVLFALTLVLFDVDAAVIVALAWMVCAMCWRWATGGRPRACLPWPSRS
jgi:ABC-type transport system involved in cytochrome c biogenesis permease component